MTVGACVERARGEVEVRAVGINLRFGFIGSYVFHFFGWVEVEGKGNSLAEVGKNFLARSGTESGGGRDAGLAVVTVGNRTVRADLDDPLHPIGGGVNVKVALLDLRFGGGVIHYSLRIGARYRSTSFFLIF